MTETRLQVDPSPPAVSGRGRLIYVIGASGCGKDTLLNYARRRLADFDTVVFGHRYITRRPDPASENHIALREDEFRARARAGLFALSWESHGLQYGIGIEVDAWLSRGLRVVVNGSRAYLPRARARYPCLLPILVQVSPACLRQRLVARGREGSGEIEARLARHRQQARRVPPDVVTLCNDGPVAEAGERLIRWIAGSDATPSAPQCHTDAKQRC